MYVAVYSPTNVWLFTVHSRYTCAGVLLAFHSTSRSSDAFHRCNLHRMNIMHDKSLGSAPSNCIRWILQLCMSMPISMVSCSTTTHLKHTHFTVYLYSAGSIESTLTRFSLAHQLDSVHLNRLPIGLRVDEPQPHALIRSIPFQVCPEIPRARPGLYVRDDSGVITVPTERKLYRVHVWRCRHVLQTPLLHVGGRHVVQRKG